MSKMHARSSPAGGFSSHPVQRSETSVAPGRALDEIRELLSQGNLPAARELAAAAAGRHPDHPELRNAKRVLCDGRSFPIDASIRTSDREFEWLRDPPEAYRGQAALLARARYVPIRYSYRPASPDPGDDLVSSTRHLFNKPRQRASHSTR